MTHLYAFLLLWCRVATASDPLAPLEDKELATYCYWEASTQ